MLKWAANPIDHTSVYCERHYRRFPVIHRGSAPQSRNARWWIGPTGLVGPIHVRRCFACPRPFPSPPPAPRRHGALPPRQAAPASRPDSRLPSHTLRRAVTCLCSRRSGSGVAVAGVCYGERCDAGGGPLPPPSRLRRPHWRCPRWRTTRRPGNRFPYRVVQRPALFPLCLPSR